MKKAQIVSIVRERGQVTIPDSIRKIAKWISPSAVITISLEKPDKISIEPHVTKEEMHWDKIWDAVHLARSFKGKHGHLSSLIAKDRQDHD